MDSLVEQILAHSSTRPDKIALIDKDTTLTYQELGKHIQYAASALKKLAAKGDCILIQANHSCAFVVGVLAIHYAGLVCVPVDKNLPKENLAEIIGLTKAQIIIGNSASSGIQEISFEQIMQCAEDVRVNEFPHKDDLADLFFTTGTTGKPKGVTYDHRALVAVVENLINGSHMEDDTVYLVYGPLNHVFSVRKIYYTLYCGCSVVLLSGLLNVKLFFSMMDKWRVTATHLLPTAAKMLFKLTGDKLGDYKDQLTFIETGTAPFAEEDKTRLRDLLPNTRLYFGYGCSEADCATKIEYSKYPDKKDSVGRTTVHTTIMIVDKNRNEIVSTRDHPGYVAIKGDMNMTGYWNEPELTAEVMENGFVFTNDIGYFDDEGFLYILGRDGDVINVGGIKVSAKEIEDKAILFPAVEDCAVIPIPDAISIQVPKLFVKIKDGEVFDEKEIMAFLAGYFETYMLPRVITQTDQIPRTFNGKIIKSKLK